MEELAMVDYVAEAVGETLSVEQQTALQASLVELRHTSRLSRLTFWGRVRGEEADYFVVAGFDTPVALAPSKWFYSLDCIAWSQLVEVASEEAEACTHLQVLPFKGIPPHKYKIKKGGDLASQSMQGKSKAKAEGEEEEEEEEEKEKGDKDNDTEGATKDSAEDRTKDVEDDSIYVTEETRLAAFVATVERHAAVVPKGAYFLDSFDRIVRNRYFDGLPPHALTDLHYYCHTHQDPDISRTDREAAFLQTLATDAPEGCWTIRVDLVSSLVYLRNLMWPGACFLYNSETRRHGYCYMGNGCRNVDIMFML